MNRSRIITTAIAATAVLGAAGAGLAHAAGDPTVGKQVLDLLCQDAGGSPVFTPYAIGRCQEARANEGTEIEALVCEGLLGGTFSWSETFMRPSRVNWACVPGA